MKKITQWIIAISFVFTFGGGLLCGALPSAVSAASSSCSEPSLLGLKTWYHGLTKSDCSIKVPDGNDGLRTFIFIVALNVLEDLIIVTAYITAGFIIYGGFMYMTSGGNSDAASKARETILHAAIGLVITLAAVAIIQFVTLRMLG